MVENSIKSIRMRYSAAHKNSVIRKWVHIVEIITSAHAQGYTNVSQGITTYEGKLYKISYGMFIANKIL